LLALVVAAAHTGAAHAAHGVYLVDKDNRRRCALSGKEEVAHAEAPTPTNISTNSEPEIEKNGTPASPATARASKRLAGARRAHQENAFGDARTDVEEFFRIFKKSTISSSSSLPLWRPRHL
jgi:hypothetical protein